MAVFLPWVVAVGSVGEAVWLSAGVLVCWVQGGLWRVWRLVAAEHGTIALDCQAARFYAPSLS